MKWVATRLICPLFSKQPIMKPEISIQDLLFGVDQVPVEAVVGTNGHTRRITIPGKKALINKLSGQVLGVVSRDYRVVTNQEAVNLAREACRIAFPGVSRTERTVLCLPTPTTDDNLARVEGLKAVSAKGLGSAWIRGFQHGRSVAVAYRLRGKTERHLLPSE